MPDLLTHLLTGYIVSRPMARRSRRSIFYIGSILPDLFSRIPILFIAMIINREPGRLYWFFTNFHSPFAVIWISLLISLLFARERTMVFLILLAGSGFHFFLDFLQRHFRPVYFWFFPFSWETGELGLFWQDDSIYAIPFLISFIVILEGLIFVRKRRIKVRC